MIFFLLCVIFTPQIKAAKTCEYTFFNMNVKSFYLKGEIKQSSNKTYYFNLNQNDSYMSINGKTIKFKTLINANAVSFYNLNKISSNWTNLKDNKCPEGLVYIDIGKNNYQIYFGDAKVVSDASTEIVVNGQSRNVGTYKYQVVLENNYKKSDDPADLAKVKTIMDEKVANLNKKDQDYLNFGCNEESTYQYSLNNNIIVWNDFEKVNQCKNKLSELSVAISDLTGGIAQNKVYYPSFDYSSYQATAEDYQKKYEKYKKFQDSKGKTDGSDDNGYNGGTDVSGCEVVPEEVQKWIRISLNFVKYIALVLVVVLGTIDFIKAAGSGEPDAMKKSGQTFIKRVVAVIILFLLPMIVELILHLINLYGSTDDCFNVLS